MSTVIYISQRSDYVKGTMLAMLMCIAPYYGLRGAEPPKPTASASVLTDAERLEMKDLEIKRIAALHEATEAAHAFNQKRNELQAAAQAVLSRESALAKAHGDEKCRFKRDDKGYLMPKLEWACPAAKVEQPKPEVKP